MRHTKVLALISLSLIATWAWADGPNDTILSTNPVATNSPYSNLTTSNAMAFAIQAGAIAGAAQSCGQDTTVYAGRVNEALNKLAQSATDKLLAITNYQKALEQSQTAQMTEHTIPCTQVIQDFNSLPLMRDDYETTVISQLTPTMGSSAPSAPLPINGTSMSPMLNNNVANPNYGAVNNSPNTNGNSPPPVYSNTPPLAPAVNPVPQTYPSPSNSASQPSAPNATGYPQQQPNPNQAPAGPSSSANYPQMTQNNPGGMPTILSPNETLQSANQAPAASQPQAIPPPQNQPSNVQNYQTSSGSYNQNIQDTAHPNPPTPAY